MASRESLSSGVSLHEELSEVDEADHLFENSEFAAGEFSGSEVEDSATVSCN